MQNIELLQLGLAFPSPRLFSGLGDLAIARLKTQFPHYVNEEGVILEHSAGYQEFGVSLLAAVLRDAELTKKTIGGEFRVRYQRALAVYANLRRNDGSLPAWGDTFFGEPNIRPLVTSFDLAGQPSPLSRQLEWPNHGDFALLPSAGLAVWWAPNRGSNARVDGQTVVAWSFFQGLAHKRPDELSVIIRSGGEEWWTSLGYLTDATFGMNPTSSWESSNAPHLVNESATGARESKLLGYVGSSGLRLLDLERHTRDGFFVRRQVVNYGDVWIIFDSWMDAVSRRVRTVWLTDSEIDVSGSPNQRFRLAAPKKRGYLDVTFLQALGDRPRLLTPDRRSLTGWVTRGHSPVPSHAILVEMPSKSGWSLNASSYHVDQAPLRVAHLNYRIDADHWSATVATLDGSISFARHADILSVSTLTGTRRASVSRPDENSMSQQEVRKAYNRDVAAYPGPLRELWPYRLKMTVLILVLLTVQLTTLLLSRLRPIRAEALVAVIVVCFWSTFGLWTVLVYFAD
jgi:hypothetical protein